MRIIALTFLAVLLAAATVSAQVAAPSLNPTPTPQRAPVNPAVLPWDGPSRVGAAYGQVSQKDNAGLSLADGTSYGLSAQWVGEMWAAAATITSASVDFDPVNNPPGGSAKFGVQALTVAGQFGEMATLGLAYEQNDEQTPGNDETETTPLVGGTVRLIDVIYIGAAIGTGTRKDNLNPPDQLKRAVHNYGVAYQWREKDRGVHAEYYQGNRAAVDNGVLNVDEDAVSGYTLEGMIANFMVGYQSQTTDNTDPLGVAQGSTDSTTITLGYVPTPGWSIVATQTSEDSLDNAGAVQDTATFTTVGVALRW